MTYEYGKQSAGIPVSNLWFCFSGKGQTRRLSTLVVFIFRDFPSRKLKIEKRIAKSRENNKKYPYLRVQRQQSWGFPKIIKFALENNIKVCFFFY